MKVLPVACKNAFLFICHTKIGKKGLKTDLKNLKFFPNFQTASLVLFWGTRRRTFLSFLDQF